ncbi:hypothetical protein [Clostridium butyricum]|uniref:hypothetical protein n=1 Tax=Clostridium butyricum TaxID=1492 RepID=UPI002AB1C482|nr:hypothetical protein [Clostridium butyricum]
MKTLLVHNKQGQLVFTQTNATEQYSCIVEDVGDNKEIIGVDISTGKCITVDRQATTEEKEQLKRELNEKNKELENTKQELLKTQAAVVDVTYNNLLK